jgi:hypothetical protein
MDTTTPDYSNVVWLKATLSKDKRYYVVSYNPRTVENKLLTRQINNSLRGIVQRSNTSAPLKRD